MSCRNWTTNREHDVGNSLGRAIASVELVNNPPVQRIAELKAYGPDDPDGSRSAAVLAAYFHAEHMKAFRQLLWRRLGVGAFGWFLVGVVTDVLSRNALFVGLGLFVVVAAWAAVVEWRAGTKLNRLLGENRPT